MADVTLLVAVILFLLLRRHRRRRHQIKKSAARKEWVRPVFQGTRSRNLLQEKNGCVLSFKSPDQEICCKKRMGASCLSRHQIKKSAARKEWVRPVFQGEARRAHDHYHNLSDILVHYRATHKSGRVKQRSGKKVFLSLVYAAFLFCLRW